MTISKSPPIHPGEILRELYLEPLGMSAYALARHLNVPRTRIERIAGEKLGITADTALRLAKFSRPPRNIGLTCRTPLTLRRLQ